MKLRITLDQKTYEVDVEVAEDDRAPANAAHAYIPAAPTALPSGPPPPRPADAAWAATFLIGRRPKRLLESRKLAQWAIEESGIPDWLFGECYHAVGDFAETIALLLPPAQSS